MNKPTKLGDFANGLARKEKSPLQKVVPIEVKPQTKKYLMNLPIDLYEFLRKKAFDENTSIKDLIITSLEKTYPKIK